MANGKLDIGESLTITRTIQGFLIEGTGPDFARSRGNARLVVNVRKAGDFVYAILSGTSGTEFHAIRDLLRND